MTKKSGSKNPLALVIEDNVPVSEVFKTAMVWAEFETEVIQDGQIAMERLAVVTPVVVLLDLHLPHVSGDEILRYIRSEPRLAQTQVILATADLMRAEALEAAVDYVLIKPFGFSQLHDLAKKIRAALAE